MLSVIIIALLGSSWGPDLATASDRILWERIEPLEFQKLKLRCHIRSYASPQAESHDRKVCFGADSPLLKTNETDLKEKLKKSDACEQQITDWLYDQASLRNPLITRESHPLRWADGIYFSKSTQNPGVILNTRDPSSRQPFNPGGMIILLPRPENICELDLRAVSAQLDRLKPEFARLSNAPGSPKTSGDLVAKALKRAAQDPNEILALSFKPKSSDPCVPGSIPELSSLGRWSLRVSNVPDGNSQSAPKVSAPKPLNSRPLLPSHLASQLASIEKSLLNLLSLEEAETIWSKAIIDELRKKGFEFFSDSIQVKGRKISIEEFTKMGLKQFTGDPADQQAFNQHLAQMGVTQEQYWNSLTAFNQLRDAVANQRTVSENLAPNQLYMYNVDHQLTLVQLPPSCYRTPNMAMGGQFTCDRSTDWVQLSQYVYSGQLRYEMTEWGTPKAPHLSGLGVSGMGFAGGMMGSVPTAPVRSGAPNAGFGMGGFGSGAPVGCPLCPPAGR